MNSKWSNPTGEWRVGLKRAYELFPKMLVKRVKEERRKEWDKKHLAAEVWYFAIHVADLKPVFCAVEMLRRCGVWLSWSLSARFRCCVSLIDEIETLPSYVRQHPPTHT